MCARNDIDIKNNKIIERLVKDYPDELIKYINSMSRKTTYTKLAYTRYIINFLNYITEKYNYNISNIETYNKIKPMDIDAYMENIKYTQDGKEKSGTFRAANLAAINGYFKFLLLNDIIKSNPCQYTEIPRDNNEHEIITISDEDLNAMIENIKNGVGNKKAVSIQRKWINRDIALLTLGITTGLRVSAISGINIDDINFEEKYIIVTEKGDIRKKVFIGDKTIQTIIRWMMDRSSMVDKNEPALFIAQGKKRMSVRAIENRIKTISECTGKHITPHKMRATCATKLYEQTGDVYLVQQQLGHKNIRNTERYARVSDQRKREAAEILDSLY